MSEPTEQELAEAFRSAPPIVLAAGPSETTATPPPPNETWELPGGTAWVYYGAGHTTLTRPVILADGFNTGPSTLEFSWEGLEVKNHAFISQLRAAGKDVVLLGFEERSASILKNAETAIAAIQRANSERRSDRRLVVGGFSMGGMVTRYALAKMESQGIRHETDVYFSYDTPHLGAYIPISLQAFAHYIRKLDKRFSDQINSDASQELLWRHIETWDAEPGVSGVRNDFLAALEAVGGWPQIPRKIGVANGVATGVGNGIKAGETAVKGKGLGIIGTDLRTQPTDEEALAAALRVITWKKGETHAAGLPGVDGAPGGTLHGFGILADTLNKILGLGVNDLIREHCFVPAGSAVAVRGLDTHDDLFRAIEPGEGELDEFLCSSRNEEHTKMTAELCDWLVERF
ncbi:esterase/lipase family protein [Streptomyces katsurahamanus]|uniref:DUF676 domain-containing protein n=1 Tax=Streptomyces katsurahamanus TaxID=2577098 RepID=A0ABW9P0I7_9ACTN|nr:hypothetical protein [Streptomyces katsurahamanus]MQS39096.1 hypothetical protein [Streptomyces katsurahamanus]